MTTLDHRPPEGAEHEPYRNAALGFLATGLTAATVREYASDALYVSRAARANRISAQEAYAELLLIADAIGALEAQGLTREQACLLVPDDLSAA